ncbi:hypothetical protein BKA62DRAFT_813297 [Auriculariales sp. MPI-PUGE-AT-0066]|nr:hypothetical protein BKA62DRAFT_813297 [Auriculariales sp. MPI-PUGE-AT-0066]
MSSSNEQYLTLPDERVLAYAQCGNLQSNTVVIWFHGIMAVGEAKKLPKGLDGKDVHFISPTLPGLRAFHEVVPKDTLALILHLHPDALTNDDFRLFVAGGSYGTVPAQIVYGCSHDLFPLNTSQKMKGCLLASGFCPMYRFPEFTSHLTWANYIAIGSWSVAIPFRLIPRLITVGISLQVNTLEKARSFVQKFIIDKMSEEERRSIEAAQGRTVEEVRDHMGDIVFRSTQKSWEGYIDFSHAANSDWKLRPEVFKQAPGDEIEAELTTPRVLVTTTHEDDLAAPVFSEWSAKNFKNAELKVYPGGHIGILGYMKEVWEALLAYDE